MDVKKIAGLATLLLVIIIVFTLFSGDGKKSKTEVKNNLTVATEPSKTKVIARIVDLDKRRQEASSASGTTGSGPKLPPCPLTFSKEETQFFESIEKINRNPAIVRAKQLRENGMISQAIYELSLLLEENPNDPFVQFLASSELLACYEKTRDFSKMKAVYSTMMTYSRVVISGATLSEGQAYAHDMTERMSKGKEALTNVLGDTALQGQIKQSTGVNLYSDDSQELLTKIRNSLP